MKTLPYIVSVITGIDTTNLLNLHEIFMSPTVDNDMMKGVMRRAAELPDQYDTFVSKSGQFVGSSISINSLNVYITEHNTYLDLETGLHSIQFNWKAVGETEVPITIKIQPSTKESGELNVRIGVNYAILTDYLRRDWNPEFDEYDIDRILDTSSANSSEYAESVENKSIVYYDYLVGINCTLVVS